MSLQEAAKPQEEETPLRSVGQEQDTNAGTAATFAPVRDVTPSPLQGVAGGEATTTEPSTTTTDEQTTPQPPPNVAPVAMANMAIPASAASLAAGAATMMPTPHALDMVFLAQRNAMASATAGMTIPQVAAGLSAAASASATTMPTPQALNAAFLQAMPVESLQAMVAQQSGASFTSTNKGELVAMLQASMTGQSPGANLDTKPRASEEVDESTLLAAETIKLKCTDEIQVQKELDEMFETYNSTKFDGLPPYQHPEGFKEGVSLMDHQKDGTMWLIEQEENYKNRKSPFFKERSLGRQGNVWYVNNLTRQFLSQPPIPDVGSILADDMGLGKSIQTLALMLSCPPKENEPRATLLVAPVSVISAWQFQISKFIEEGHWNVEVYLGPHRQKLLNRLKRKDDLDLVLTSYETLMSDWKNYQAVKADKEEAKALARKNKAKKSGSNFIRDAWNGGDDDWMESSDSDDSDDDDHYLPASMTRKRKATTRKNAAWIFEHLFYRIVCDEAHKLRNPSTHFFKSCCGILAQRRLAITGTPYVNKPEDLNSLFRFLNANNPNASNPLLPPKQFAEYVTAPIRNNNLIGLSRIRASMNSVALRRTKNKVDLGLPEKEIHMVSVPFPEDGFHTEIHEKFYKVARECFLNLLSMEKKDMYRNFLEFFVLVLRIRQSCDSGHLIGAGAFDRVNQALAMLEEAEEKGEVRLDTETAKSLLEQLLKVLKPPGEELVESCGICLEEFDEKTAVALAGCHHVFCNDCMSKFLETNRNHNCPFCRMPFKSNERISVDQCKKAIKKNNKMENKDDDKPASSGGDDGQAPKITALLQKIDEMKKDEKCVIFSQWTSFLALIEKALEEKGIKVCRIVGSMSSEERLESMNALENDDEVRCCLASLHCAGVGITLNRANVSFMMDPWWNAAVQDQAIDRIHRIGQIRKVRVYQFAMKDSLEERMYKLQEAKTALGNGSLRKLTSDEKKKARITALRDLFEVTQKDVVWKGWHEKEKGDDRDDREDDDGSDLDGFIVGDDDFS